MAWDDDRYRWDRRKVNAKDFFKNRLYFQGTDFVKRNKSEHNFRIVKSPISTAMTKTYLIDKKFSTDFKDGDRVDISPDSWGVIDRIAKYLDRNGGTGLAIDYGQDYIQGDTLRVSLLWLVEMIV